MINAFKNFLFGREKSAIALNHEGIGLFKRGLPEQAQLKFEQAIELAPHHPDPLINLSVIFINNGRYPKAESMLKTSLSLNPTPQSHQYALNNLALIYFERKKYCNAIDFLKNALKVFQADHEIYYNLGACYEKLGEWEDALHYFERSKQIQNNIRAEAGIGRIQRNDWPSEEMNCILNSFFGFKEAFPPCGENELNESERIIIGKNIPANERLVFLAGAGISFSYPSCIPLASKILDQIFHILFKIDENEICELYKSKDAKNEAEIYKQVSSELNTNSVLPFEATFQALYECFDSPVLRFVEMLKRGNPNIHHIMLAYALHNGHTVITTNFDTKIEDAFADCFGDESLRILITDKDFQDVLDGNYTNGVLAKIHGDLNNYNSLALTTKGVAITCDATVNIGDEIEPEKAWKQFRQINPRTTLSIPKALFLQKMLQEKSMIVMGYSGSDVFDIMPIVTSSEFRSAGLWIAHDPISESSEISKWKNNGNNRLVLQPATEEEKKADITSKVSGYFLDLFDVSRDKISQINKLVENERESLTKSLNDQFESWIKRLRIDRGDGLFTLAKLYSKIGKWENSQNLYEKASKIYERNLLYDERRWLLTKINIGFIANNLDDNEQAVKIYGEVKEYLEMNKKESSYPDFYANVLMSISLKLMNKNRYPEANRLLEKATYFARELDDKEILCYGMRISADRLLKQKEYKEALKIYQIVHHWHTHVFADLREACFASMNSGICLAHLSDEDKAHHMLSLAEKYATHLENEELIKTIHSYQAYVHNLIRGKSRAEDYFKELTENAFSQVKKQDENILREIASYVAHEKYDKALALIDRLLRVYHQSEVQAYLLYAKSNVYHRVEKFEQEIEEIQKFQRIRPRHPLAEHNLAIAHMALKNYDFAEQHYLQAIQFMNGGYPLAVCNLGILYTEMKRLEKAKEQLRQAEKLKAPEFCLNELRRCCLELEAKLKSS